MSNLVVDRNIFWAGWMGHRPDNEDLPDYSAGIFLQQIFPRNDRIHITYEIEDKYYETFQELKELGRQTPIALNVIRLYFQLKQYGMVESHGSSSELPDLPNQRRIAETMSERGVLIKDEDLDFAKLTNLIQAVLVTFDGPLMKALNWMGISCAEPQGVMAIR